MIVSLGAKAMLVCGLFHHCKMLAELYASFASVMILQMSTVLSTKYILEFHIQF